MRAVGSPFVWHRSLTLLAFVVLGVAAYGRTLDGWFLSDDVMIGNVIPDGHVSWRYVFATFVSDWGLRGPEVEIRYYRPLVILSQAMDAAMWGVNPVGYHLTNTALHGANGYLVHRLGRALGAPGGAAVMAGAAFVLFPLNVEAVAWISGRTDVLWRSRTGRRSSIRCHYSEFWGSSSRPT